MLEKKVLIPIFLDLYHSQCFSCIFYRCPLMLTAFQGEDNAFFHGGACQAICSVLVTEAAWLPPYLQCEFYSIYLCHSLTSFIQYQFYAMASQSKPVTLPLLWIHFLMYIQRKILKSNNSLKQPSF